MHDANPLQLTVAFDADDTLWHNEDLFHAVEREFENLMSPWADAATAADRLHEVQMANLGRFGYGAKSFTLSMLEAAIALSGEEIDAARLAQIIEHGKRLVDRPVELIDGVEEVLDALEHHRLMIITKGDVHDQLSKVHSSGLAERFWRIEVMADKHPEAYIELLERHEIKPERFVMVGNSLRSDVLPVLELGAAAVHVPYPLTWRHELAHAAGNLEFPTLEGLHELPHLLRAWTAGGGVFSGPAGTGRRFRAHPA